MEFRNLKEQYKVLKNEMDAATQEVLTDCNFISGKQVKELEAQLAEYVGVKHCITCANGTDALSLALMAWNIGPGDAVFVPDFTFFASGETASFLGAKPFFVDVCQDTYNIDAAKLEKTIQKVIVEGKYTPKVIVPVDLFGQAADYPAIQKIADKYGLLILEDAAQGFGATINRKRAGSFGDISATSFFPAKPLGCYGDGGAVFTNDDAVDEIIRSYCVHGKGSFKYDNVRIGMNSRLDTLQAAILKVKLKAFKEYELRDINEVARYYQTKLKKLTDVLTLPVIPEGFTSSWAQYTIQLSDEETRDGLQAYLKEQGIPSMVYYPKPMHKQAAFGLTEETDDFSVTNKLCETVLSLPIHPYMSNAENDVVVKAIENYFHKN